MKSLQTVFLALSALQVDVSEIFCPGRFTSRATAFDLIPGVAYDLRCGKDLSKPSVVEEVWNDLQATKPWLVVGSPRCAPFSVLQAMQKDTTHKVEHDAAADERAGRIYCAGCAGGGK